jgi:ACS family glucarate transporter-like MFS transporter
MALPIFIVVWSIAAGLTGFATGFAFLLVFRMLLGIGESPVTTAGQVVIREWTPEPERGTVSSMFTSGSLFGPAIGAVVAAILIRNTGWRASFLIIGAFGIVIGVAWYLVYSAPERSRWLPKAEREYVVASRETHAGIAPEKMQQMGVLKLLAVPSVWGCAIAMGTLVYTGYLFLTFLPLYLVQVQGFEGYGAGWVTGVTYGVATLGCLTVGFVADRAARRATEAQRGSIRRRTLTIAMVASVPLLLLPLINATWLIVVVVCWVLSFNFAAISLIFTLASDLTVDKRAIGRTTALITIGGNTFGLAAPIVTGYVVDATGSYTVPFLIAGGLAVVGAVLVTVLARRPLQTAKALQEAADI